MFNYSILLVEDNFLNRRLIKKVLLEKNYIIYEAKNVEEAIYLLNREDIHLAILDINLGNSQTTGISLAMIIQDSYKIPFIFLTAYDTSDIVAAAVSTNPNSYITKPFKNVDLWASVDIALSSYQKCSEKIITNYVIVKDKDFNIKLNISDIDYIESEGNYLLFYSKEKTYKLRRTLKQIQEILPENFIQVHRAFIINKDKVEKYNNKNIIIQGKAIPVSKKFTENFEI